MSGRSRAEALARIRRVADALAELRERVVFIGGTVLPLLVDVDDRFDAPRATKDVDAVTGTARYPERGLIEERLRQRGFRDVPTGPAGRFVTPTGDTFDLSFAGDHAGGTGAPVDRAAIATARRLDGVPPLAHLSPTGFFLMKAAAFRDRGASAPHDSRDLADLAVLLVGCHDLHTDIASRDEEVRAMVAALATDLATTPEVRSALRTHFADRRPILPDSPSDLAESAFQSLFSLR